MKHNERLTIHAAPGGLKQIRVRFPSDRRKAALQLFSRAWPSLRRLDERLTEESRRDTADGDAAGLDERRASAARDEQHGD